MSCVSKDKDLGQLHCQHARHTLLTAAMRSCLEIKLIPVGPMLQCLLSYITDIASDVNLAAAIEECMKARPTLCGHGCKTC